MRPGRAQSILKGVACVRVEVDDRNVISKRGWPNSEPAR
jgi:hypothetical protein